MISAIALDIAFRCLTIMSTQRYPGDLRAVFVLLLLLLSFVATFISRRPRAPASFTRAEILWGRVLTVA